MKGNHAEHAGRACAFDRGTCRDCGVCESTCDECKGTGYHAMGCSEVEGRENLPADLPGNPWPSLLDR